MSPLAPLFAIAPIRSARDCSRVALVWLAAMLAACSQAGPAPGAQAEIQDAEVAEDTPLEAAADGDGVPVKDDTGDGSDGPGDIAKDISEVPDAPDTGPSDASDAGEDQEGDGDAAEPDLDDAQPDLPDVLTDVPDSTELPDNKGDASNTPPTWLGVCPPTQLSAFGSAVPMGGFSPPGVDCAKPGWPSPAAVAAPKWTDITAAVGLDKLGVLDGCLLWQDFNGDGLEDLLLVEQPTGPTSKRFARLYQQNDQNKWLMTSILLPSSLLVIDCSPIDWDNDGDFDVVLGTTTGLRLLRYSGGMFSDDTTNGVPSFAKGVMTWSMAALDADHDGDHDLYVARTGVMNLQPGNYTCYPADGQHVECCYGQQKAEEACMAKVVSTPIDTWTCCAPAELGASNLMMRQDGAVFVDASLGSGADDGNASLTVATADIDRDGWTDLFVGNDFAPLHWLRPAGGGTFQSLGTQLGLRPYGHTMGVAVADFDLDGHIDMSAADVGPLTLYKGLSAGGWQATSPDTQISEPTKEMVNWAQLAADLDNDGWIDLWSSSSLLASPGQLIQAVQSGAQGTFIKEGHHVLFHNQGTGFKAESIPWAATTEPTITPMPVAAADFDGDGDLDIVHLTPPGLVRVLRNDSPKAHWLKVEMVPSKSSTGGLGARVQVWSQGHVQEREIQAAPSTLAHGTYARHFGLGSVATLDQVAVWWPSGCVQLLGPTAADQTLNLFENQATCPTPPMSGGDAGPSDGGADTSDGSDAAADAGSIGLGGPEASGIAPLNLLNATTAAFSDITGQLGLGDGATTWHHDCAAGIDVDGDDRDDIVTVESISQGPGKTIYQIRVFLNKESGLQTVLSKIDGTLWLPALGCSVLDVNGDAKPDLLIGTLGAGFAYYQNNGTGGFVDQTAATFPYGDFDAWMTTAGDLDGDGDLEIYAAAGNTPGFCDGVSCGYVPGDFFCKFAFAIAPTAELQDHLYKRPNLMGKFADMGGAWSLAPGGLAPEIAMIDLDRDGWLDVLVGNDYGDHFLLHNQKGKPQRFDKELGFADYAHAMGWGIGDFDRDGLDDLVLADAGPVPFYRGVKPGPGLPVAFVEQGKAWGLAAATHDVVTWDPLVADFDQDGWEDLWLGTAAVAPGGGISQIGMCQIPKNLPPQRDLLMRNTGTGTFEAMVGPEAPNQEVAFAATSQTTLDLDEDGDLDIVQVRRGGHLHIYRNDMAQPGTSVRVRLKAKSGNTAQLGAWLTAKVGSATMVRHILGNTGYGGAGVWVAHFGLGLASQIDELTVHWPGGATSTLQNVKAGSKLTLSP